MRFATATPNASDQAAFVLHRQAFRENSFLVDVFSLNFGRLRVLAKGHKKNKAKLSAELQAFQPLRITWVGKSDLKMLTQLDATAPAHHLTGQRMYCGFYMNELLVRMYPEWDSNPLLFASYAQALQDLCHEGPMDLPLRRFELQLCESLGIMPDFRHLGLGQEKIRAQAYYRWSPEAGFQALEAPRQGAIEGRLLLAMAGDILHLNDAERQDSQRLELQNEVRKSAKGLMRQVIDHALNGRPLKSRELMGQLRSSMRSETNQ